MKKIVAVSKNLDGYIKFILAATRDDINFEPDEDNLRIIFSAFEAYRTGIPEIRKLLKPRVRFLRVFWPTYQLGYYEGDLSTKQILKNIDTGYKYGCRIYGCYSTGDSSSGDFMITFTKDRVPMVTYKPLYTPRFHPVSVEVSKFLKDIPQDFLSDRMKGYYKVNEARLIQNILKDLVKC